MAFPGFPGGNGSSSFTAAGTAAAAFAFRRWWCLRCATVMAAAKAAGADGPRVPGALSTCCGAWEHATDNTPEGVLFSDGATNNMANEYNDFLRRKFMEEKIKHMVLL